MIKLTSQKNTPTERFTRREIVAALNLSTMGELSRLRVKLGADFPTFVNGTADQSEILALKNALANSSGPAQPDLPVAPQQGRRICMDRRRV